MLKIFLAVHLAEATWTRLNPAGVRPSARKYHASVWSDEADGIFVFGGEMEQSGATPYLDDLQFYDRQADAWRQVVPLGTAPAAREGHSAVWSPSAKGFYVFGGCCGNWVHTPKLHFFDGEATSWSEVSDGPAPTGRSGASAVWSPPADGFYLFGGSSAEGTHNDVLFYDRASSRWMQVNPAGSAPSIRSGAAGVWSPTDGFYIFGGEYMSKLGDLHFYGRQANEWSSVSPGGSAPSARTDASAVWSPLEDGFYLFGGQDVTGAGLNDLHFYDRVANSWSQIALPGAPTARYGHSAVWAAAAGGFYVFGGQDSSGEANDLNFFQGPTTTTTTTTMAWTSLEEGETSNAVMASMGCCFLGIFFNQIC